MIFKNSLVFTDNRLIEESFQQEMQQEKSTEDNEDVQVRKRRTKSKEAGDYISTLAYTCSAL